MRILKFLSISLLSLLFLGFLGFFVGREVILAWGASIVKNDYNNLLQKTYSDNCAKQFSYSQDYWTQIRFTSEKEYNLEVVCADFTSTPIVLATKKLLPLLYKESFGSGFVIDDEKLPEFIKLKVLGRSLFVYTDAQTIHSSYLSQADLDYSQGPMSSCQSHGYQCCSLDLQSGIGSQTESVTDCPKSCYESCFQRPMVLSFNSRPALNDANRTASIRSGEAVTFSYVLGNGKGDAFKGQIDKATKTSFLEKLQTVFYESAAVKEDDAIVFPLKVMIDFGDGEFLSSINAQDTFDHIYYCQNSLCYFQAKITVEDARGVLSLDNELAKIIIKVSRI